MHMHLATLESNRDLDASEELDMIFLSKKGARYDFVWFIITSPLFVLLTTVSNLDLMSNNLHTGLSGKCLCS